MSRTLHLALTSSIMLFGLGACSGDTAEPDAGSTSDTGTADPDAGSTSDTGTAVDSGTTPDAGTADSGTAPDTTPPTVAITDSAPGVATRDVTFTFTFSEDVGTTFTIDDVTVAGGTAGAFNAASGMIATLVVAPPADSAGTITVTVAAMSFEDAAGNQNVDAATAEQAFDTTPAGPFDGVVFDDDFGAGVAFAGFNGAINDVSVDTAEAQSGTAALRVRIPDADYGGGALAVMPGVDVSGFDAVTFWVKADSAKTLNVVGIGNDAADTTFNTERVNLPLTTAWTQFTIPIPNSSVLTTQTGLFHIAEGSDEGAYTIWLDEIRYVNLDSGAVTNERPSIAPATEALAVGETFGIGGASVVLALNGTEVTLQPSAPAYFDYTSSDTAVATVDTFGVVTAVANGTAEITASLGSTPALGTVTINVGAGCTPTGPNLAVNGDFETGDFSCVVQFLNGGTQTITTMNPEAGTYASRLTVTAMDVDTVMKFANLTPGAFSPGETIYIDFDMRGSVTPGGVVFAEFFSELTGGGTSSAEILFGNAPILPGANPDTWTNFSTTAVTGSDTSGGITLQLKAASGAGTADVYFDNVCVSKTPCP